MRKSARAALRHAYLIYFVVAALCLLTLGFVVVRQENTRYEHSVRELVARDALDVAKGIEEKLFSMELIANRLAAIATVADEVPEKLITDAARSLVSHHPDIITVAIAPDLKVAHVAPLAGNELVLGMDYRDLPEQLASISHAYRAHAPVLAGPVNLVQGGTGYVMRYPVYTAAGTGFWGVISIVFKEEGLFAVHSDQRNFEGEIDFALKAAAAEGDWGQKYFGDPAVFDRDPVMQSASILNGAWVVAAAPVGAWPMISPKMVPIILVLVLAAAVVAAIVYKIRSLTKQNERTHKILSNAVEALDAGFVLYDEQDRLMVCNSTFRSYYEPTIQEMKPGIRYQTLIKLAA
ncbi:MAG: CHASE domain-containing protein, partial [Pseudooceanicola sp.]